MTRRYTDDLSIEQPTSVIQQPTDNTKATSEDLVIEFIDEVLDGNPVSAIRKFYEVECLQQPVVIGLTGTVANTQFQTTWNALGRPLNAEFSVLTGLTELPSWYVRFSTDQKLAKVVSANLNPTYYTWLIGMFNEKHRSRSGYEITTLTVDQHKHFITRINTLLRAL